MRKRYNYKKKYYGKGRGVSKRQYLGNGIDHDKYVSKASKEDNASPYVESKMFENYNIDKLVIKNIKYKGFDHPTKIQDQAIPTILQGLDVIGQASTGSGKTAAFLIPMVTKLLRHSNQRCLIVIPTRELANQINDEFKWLSYGSHLKSVIVVGGTGYSKQISQIKRDPQFVIATPGRLLDLEERNNINLQVFNNIILDEVDRMLDMGFIKDIMSIVSKLSDIKQSLFFSATMDKRAEGIAKSLLTNPRIISVEKQNPSVNVDQSIIKYSYIGEKINILDETLKKVEYEKVLVFSRTKRGADSLSKELNRRGHKTDVLHGNKTQNQRNRVVSNFRKSRFDILVATDVAARGIDIPNISHIINFDEPDTYSDYIHRIGRTGRIGRKGVALTFVR